MTSSVSGTVARREVDAVILGAGISGLVAAKLVRQNGARSILIVDEYDRVGGNHISCDVGAFTFDIGTLIFQDDSPLMKYFPELLPLYHPVDISISRVAPDDVVREYPLSMKDEVYGNGLLKLLLLLGSLVWGRCRLRHFANADDYARYWIGARLFTGSGLAHYISRFYGVPASAIDAEFAVKRMGWLAEGASIGKRVRKLLRRSQKGQGNQSFVRPRAGFDALYAAARRTLEQEGTSFALGQTVRGITRRDGRLHVATDGLDIACARLISTIPVDRAAALCGSPCGQGKPDRLPCRRLVSLFFSFSGERGFASNVLYNFSYRGAWKRLTMFSDFFGQVDDRQYFGVEVTVTEDQPCCAEQAAAAFAADVAAKGLFAGSLTFVGSHIMDHAYPIYTRGASARAAAMIAALQAFGVESMGRQGGFDYLPTARQVTLAVEKTMKLRPKPWSPGAGVRPLMP